MYSLNPEQLFVYYAKVLSQALDGACLPRGNQLILVLKAPKFYSSGNTDLDKEIHFLAIGIIKVEA